MYMYMYMYVYMYMCMYMYAYIYIYICIIIERERYTVKGKLHMSIEENERRACIFITWMPDGAIQKTAIVDQNRST